GVKRVGNEPLSSGVSAEAATALLCKGLSRPLEEFSMKKVRWIAFGVCLMGVAFACSKSTPSAPSIPVTATTSVPAGGGGGGTLSVPAPDSPNDNEQLTTLRPTLTAKNSSGTQAGRTYEFQVADRTDFALTASSRIQLYAVASSKTGVP